MEGSVSGPLVVMKIEIQCTTGSWTLTEELQRRIQAKEMRCCHKKQWSHTKTMLPTRESVSRSNRQLDHMKTPDHLKKMQAEVVWTCFPFIRSGQNHFARHNERGKKADRRRSGKRASGNVQAWSLSSPRRQWRKMEETGCDNFLDKSSGPQWPSWLTDRWRWRWWRCYKRMLKRLKVHSKRLHVHLKRSDGRNYCTVIILQKQNLHILRLNCPDPNQVKTIGYKILMPFCTYFMYSLILLARNHAWTVTAARYSFSLCASDSLGKKRK